MRVIAQGTEQRPKSWWAPVWSGLVVDPAGKHVRRLGKAMGLLLYLILSAERETGIVRRRMRTIASATGMPLRTVQGWLRRLRERGYVSVRQTGRVAQIDILKWKRFSNARDAAVLPRKIWRDPRQTLRGGDGRDSRNGSQLRGDSGNRPRATNSHSQECI